MAALSTPTDTGLKKMTIYTFKTEKFKEGDKGKPEKFELMFNPTTYTSKYEVVYEPEQGKGNTAGAPKFGKIKPRDFSFEFILDGTGVSAKKVSVHEKIEEFLDAAVRSREDTHRPHFLTLNWGTLAINVILKTADVAITLLDAQGNPLRAKITAVFTESIEDTLRVRQENQRSPNLTHLRQVKTDSKLPIMAEKEYRDHTYYLSVARANNLNNFRRLNVGSQIKLPPLVNEEKKA
ncbi:MAG: hypothetical protein MUC87_20470 [Bacteroidia bacterium]|jgi:hypothetical protein|nr:hypothetical protein [Bacteroidia bacterium]